MRGFEPGSRVALLISECQRGVIDPGLSLFSGLVEQVAERGIVAKIKHLAQVFRDSGAPVVHLHVAHPVDYVGVPMTSLIVARSAKTGAMLIGSDDVEPVPELVPQDGDIVHCRGFSLVAFHGTDLDSVLRNRGITTLVMVGVSSNIAIPGMALCASDFGYQVIVPEDCIAGATPESHAFTITNTLPLYSTLTMAADVEAAVTAMSSGDVSN